MRKVEVTPYNENWPLMYEKEANKLRNIFGSEIIEIYHIGSTSVDGLTAKPVIDIGAYSHRISLLNIPVYEGVGIVEDLGSSVSQSLYTVLN